MDLNLFLDSPFFLELVMVLMFLFFFGFSTNYLIPKGIVFFREWLRAENYKMLSFSVSYFVCGIFVLLYLFVKILIM